MTYEVWGTTPYEQIQLGIFSTLGAALAEGMAWSRENRKEWGFCPFKIYGSAAHVV